MNKYFQSTEIGIKFIAWLMSDKTQFSNELSEFLSTHKCDLKSASDWISTNGLERNFFNNLHGLEKIEIDWLMVGIKLALLNNIAYQNYEKIESSAFTRVSYQFRLALEEANIPFVDRDKFEDLAITLKNATNDYEKNYTIRKVEELLRSITNNLENVNIITDEDFNMKVAIKKIKNHIASGEIEKSFDDFESLQIYDKIENDILLLRGRFSKLNSNMRRGIINKADSDVEYNNITNSLLEILSSNV